jgi:hypothetical protein
MREHHFFREMTLSTDPAVIQRSAPLVIEGREPGPVAATTGAGSHEGQDPYL